MRFELWQANYHLYLYLKIDFFISGRIIVKSRGGEEIK